MPPPTGYGYGYGYGYAPSPVDSSDSINSPNSNSVAATAPFDWASQTRLEPGRGVGVGVGAAHAQPPAPAPLSRLSFAVDPTVYYLLGQLEYYLSPQNMAQDFFLRQQVCIVFFLNVFSFTHPLLIDGLARLDPNPPPRLLQPYPPSHHRRVVRPGRAEPVYRRRGEARCR